MADDRAREEIERCAKAGARGLGELRPENQGWDSAGDPGDLLATLAEPLDLTLLFHVTEPVGHEYPGKHGFRLDLFYRFLIRHPDTKIVGSHMAGGLPLFQNYVREMGKVGYHFYADTAAWSHIFRSRKNLIRYGFQTFDSRRLLFGSDFPLVPQAAAIEKINLCTESWSKGGLPRVLGGNAAQLLGLRP
jgi:predicted TIM-barrel fold metal-dependent hydrolase